MKSTRLLPLFLLLTACQRAAAPPAPPEPAAPLASDSAGAATAELAAPPAAPAPGTASASASVADAWLGKWTGPEGTALEIAGDGAGYALKITSLDGPVDFYGIATPDGISFERNGAIEAIRAGTGADTGMKWLADKAHCLVVRPGEGYCRD